MFNPSRLLLTLLLAATICVAAPKKAIPLDVSGEGVAVITVVKSLPVKVTAPEGATIYLWNIPDAVTASFDENVLTVTAAPKGTYKVSVSAVYIDFDKKAVRKEKGEVTLNVGELPTPKPPEPPVPPTPPLPVGAMRVLIMYKAADIPAMKMDPARKEQADMLYKPSFKGALTDRTDKNGPNKMGWAIWPDPVEGLEDADKFWQDAVKRPRPKLPYIHIFKADKSVFDGELPKTEKETLDLINKYAGE